MKTTPAFYPWYSRVESESYETLLSQYNAEKQAQAADKSLLQTPRTFRLEEPFPRQDGCYQSVCDNATFTFFFKSCATKRLYVFLDGSRSRDRGTRFAPVPTYLSWSWYPGMDANVISMEDPMYYTFPELPLGWFYGTKEQDYRPLLARVVGTIAQQLGIENRDIVLYGRSGGGTAALAAARYLPGCTAVAVNPQIDLPKYPYYNRVFTGMTGIDVTRPEQLDRSDLARIISSDDKSRYVVVSNLASKEDMVNHTLPLAAKLGAAPRFGVSRKDNFVLWLYHAQGPGSAHNSFENIQVFQLIDLLVRKLADGEAVEEEDGLWRYANDLWRVFSDKDRAAAQQRQKTSELQTELDETKAALKETKSALKKTKSTLKESKKQIARQQKRLDDAERSLLYRCGRFLRRVRRRLRKLVSRKQV